MKSIKDIYKIGVGPSSSHTMGPKFAAQKFLSAVEGVKKFEVTLYGSLAATGKGHLTDKAILSILEPVAPTVIKWKPDVFLKFHPNGMNFKAFGAENYLIKDWTVFSIGGGDLAEEGKTDDAAKEVYEMRTIAEIQQWCEKTGRTYWEYVDEGEGPEIWNYLATVWKVMKQSIKN